MTLAKGDLINKTFEAYAKSNDVGCAWINGIGALKNPEIGNLFVLKMLFNSKALPILKIQCSITF